MTETQPVSSADQAKDAQRVQGKKLAFKEALFKKVDLSSYKLTPQQAAFVKDWIGKSVAGMNEKEIDAAIAWMTGLDHKPTPKEFVDYINNSTYATEKKVAIALPAPLQASGGGAPAGPPPVTLGSVQYLAGSRIEAWKTNKTPEEQKKSDGCYAQLITLTLDWEPGTDAGKNKITTFNAWLTNQSNLQATPEQILGAAQSIGEGKTPDNIQ